MYSFVFKTYVNFSFSDMV